jgi:hypothetical protein
MIPCARLVGSRRFVVADLCAHRSTVAVAPIDANSASVVTAAVAPPLIRQSAGAQVHSLAGARMPFNADAQIPSVAGRMSYESLSTTVGSSFVDLLQR